MNNAVNFNFFCVCKKHKRIFQLFYRSCCTITRVRCPFCRSYNVNEIRLLVPDDVVSVTEMFCRNVSVNDAVVVHVT